MTKAGQDTKRFRLRTEPARERDVFRYLHPWANEHRSAALHQNVFAGDKSNAPPEVQPCPDTALVAFAQLCALRLQARRCFVTLVSSSVEYVLAEATRSMSLQYDCVQDPRDKACLGTCSFLRDQGLTSVALDGWRRARYLRDAPTESDYFYTSGTSAHWSIISDLRGEELHMQRSLVQSCPGTRFYAAVPLRGTLGSVLGSLTIVDDAPRYGLSAAEMALMEDIADTVTQHLDATVVRSQRRRSERMVQSLGLFNTGKSSLRHWWLKQEDTRLATAGRYKAKVSTARQRRTAADTEFGINEASSSDQDRRTASISDHDKPSHGSGGPDPVTATSATLQNVNASIARENGDVGMRDFGTGSVGGTPTALSLAPVKRPKHPPRARSGRNASKYQPGVNEEFDLATSSRHTYARASNLMREALGADGVVFINASVASSGKREGLQTTGSSSEQSPHASGISDTDFSDGASAAAMRSCVVDAFSTKERSSVHGEDHSFHLPFSEEFLMHLIRRYPDGHIFQFGEDGACYSSSGEESWASGSGSDGKANSTSQRPRRDGRTLGQAFAGARTIAFYPLWDDAHDRWRSGGFVWSTSPLRHFDQTEDITYLASWSHSILAELGRLETIAADKAKGSFISSVSHELRSPLHGILAGVEFLQESELTSFQQEMAHTIGMAGRTLLDTVNHILDFTKISNFTRAQNRQRVKADVLRHGKDGTESTNSHEIGVTVNVNLARLTEEILETVVNAHRFQSLRTLKADELSVSISIPWRRNWMVELQPGGWTRILTNLVGNSLKYTMKGLISIRLEVGDTAQENGLHTLRLTIQDSGIGISKQFLSDGLYTPFKQENSHSSGTGLGLSIVRQICKDMGVDLNIASELGKGTCATLDFQVKFVPTAGATDLAARVSLSTPQRSNSRDLNVDCYHWVTPYATNSPLPSPVGQTVLRMAEDWLGCETRHGPCLETDSRPMVLAIAEEDLLRWLSEEPEVLRTRMNEFMNGSSHVLVLGKSLRSVSLTATAVDMPFTPIFVHQPIGPQKLLRAITTDRNSTGMGVATEPYRSSIDHLSTPGYEIGSTSLSSTKSPDSYFPWPLPLEIDHEPSSAMGRPRDLGGPSASRSTSQSASSTNGQRSVELSISTVSSARRFGSRASVSSHEGAVRDELQDTILLVEDNEVNMKLLMALMHKLKRKYICAIHGREALEAYRANPSSFFLILMDMSMPIMDGFMATAKIRETERKQRLSRCMIVALTGVTNENAKNLAFANGVDEFFSKPVHMRELKVLIERTHRGVEGARGQ